jgi:hypothetical protein
LLERKSLEIFTDDYVTDALNVCYLLVIRFNCAVVNVSQKDDILSV